MGLWRVLTCGRWGKCKSFDGKVFRPCLWTSKPIFTSPNNRQTDRLTIRASIADSYGQIEVVTSSQAYKLTSSQAHKLTSSQVYKLTRLQAHKLTSLQAQTYNRTQENDRDGRSFKKQWASNVDLNWHFQPPAGIRRPDKGFFIH